MKVRWHVGCALVLVGLVAPSASASASGAADSADRTAVHTTRGVVKSVDSKAIVVARPKGRGDITFKVRPSLHRDGTIAVGSDVSVRYEDEGNEHVAIAVAVRRP
jgi:hypothetical protein